MCGVKPLLDCADVFQTSRSAAAADAALRNITRAALGQRRAYAQDTFD
jgi:hypothetical protein